MSKFIKSLSRKKLILLGLTTIFILLFIFIRNDDGITKGTFKQIGGTKTIVITMPELRSQFEKMKQARWDITKPLVWGYYFYDSDKSRLEKLSAILQKEKLKVYKIQKSKDSHTSWYLLYAYEKTIHTPDSLYQRCNTLTKLAVDNQVKEFDGWEVGPNPR